MESRLSARLTKLRCSEHKGQRAEHVCCDKLMCGLCSIHHSDHNSFMNLEQKAKEIKESLPDLLQNLEDMHNLVDRKIRQTEHEARRNETMIQQNRENIHKRIKEVKIYLTEVEDSMKHDCFKRQENITQTLQTAADQQKNVLHELEAVQLSCEKLNSFKSVTEIVRCGIEVTQRFHAIDMNIRYEIPIIPEFIWPHNKPDKRIFRRLVGTINEGLDMDSDWATDESEKFEIDKHFKWKQKNIGIAPLGTDIGWLYSINRSDPIYLISENGDMIKEVENKKQRKIEKIFSTELKHAWVTDVERYSVKILRENGELDHKFSVEPYHPFGICPSRTAKCVWICLADKPTFIPKLKGQAKVVKMNNQGEEICKIKCNFTLPFRCVENVNGELCVVDRISETKGHVFIFDINCQPKGGYIGAVVDKDFDPRDICCNSRGNIIVSDFTNNAIHILKQCGTLETLLKTDSKDFLQPLTISTDQSDKIWITFYDGNVVVIKYP